MAGVAGSSPRMWGTRTAWSFSSAVVRFIPTHVGNTADTWQSSCQLTVHPHACGEHYRINRIGHRRSGSSPRMWGTLPPHGSRNSGYRFIPTHVGNTLRLVRGHISTAVHPHACGEHLNRKCRKYGGIGSSPRMWGTLSIRSWMEIKSRFIPTHVGNTRPDFLQ